MRNKIISVLAFGIVLLISGSAYSQVQYHPLDTIEDVLIEYRWQKASFFGKDPDAILNLRITNTSDEFIELVFTTGFYRDGQLFFESPEQDLCLAPGETRRGGRADLRFSAEGIRMSTIEEEWFTWDLPFINVNIVADCPED